MKMEYYYKKQLSAIRKALKKGLTPCYNHPELGFSWDPETGDWHIHCCTTEAQYILFSDGTVVRKDDLADGCNEFAVVFRPTMEMIKKQCSIAWESRQYRILKESLPD